MSDEILSAVGHNDRTGEIAKTQFAGEHAPNVNFRKKSVRKTIWDLEFRNICCKISCLPASPKIFEHLKNGNGFLP